VKRKATKGAKSGLHSGFVAVDPCVFSQLNLSIPQTVGGNLSERAEVYTTAKGELLQSVYARWIVEDFSPWREAGITKVRSCLDERIDLVTCMLFPLHRWHCRLPQRPGTPARMMNRLLSGAIRQPASFI
jgi:hypothetical protein